MKSTGNQIVLLIQPASDLRTLANKRHPAPKKELLRRDCGRSIQSIKNAPNCRKAKENIGTATQHEKTRIQPIQSVSQKKKK